jgi:hypothetical protein
MAQGSYTNLSGGAFTLRIRTWLHIVHLWKGASLTTVLEVLC